MEDGSSVWGAAMALRAEAATGREAVVARFTGAGAIEATGLAGRAIGVGTGPASGCGAAGAICPTAGGATGITALESGFLPVRFRNQPATSGMGIRIPESGPRPNFDPRGVCCAVGLPNLESISAGTMGWGGGRL